MIGCLIAFDAAPKGVPTMEDGMTKAEYIAWKAARGEAGTWDITQCQDADNLIRRETLAKFDEWAARNVPHAAVRQYLQNCARVHFGCAETDNMLTSLGLYPDWM